MFQTGYAVAIGRQYLPALSIKVVLFPVGSPANQDTQRIAPDDGVVVFFLKPVCSTYVVDVVRVCL